MRTVFASLPFYDSLSKQDLERSKAIIPIHCPRTQLPPFQWNSETVDMGDVTKIELIDKNGETYNNPCHYHHWTNTDYATFVSRGLDIVSAKNSDSSASVATLYYTYYGKTGETIRIKGNCVNTLGTNQIKISQHGGGVLQTSNLTNGAVSITYTLVGDVGIDIWVYSLDNTDFSFTSVEISVDLFNQYFPTLPTATVWSTNTYGIYNGDTLNYLLPLGLYYVKITTENNFVLYSDWIMIQNIYENLITSFSKDLYETFTTDGTRIISAIETGVSGTGISNNFSVKTGETITVYLYLTQNSGDEPSVNIHSNTFGGYISNSVQLSAGLNVVTLVTTNNDDDAFLNFYSTSASNFSTSEVWVQRTYSPHFIQLAFKNTNNLGDIFYDGTFEQKVWLDTVMGTPTHETVTFGEEKDGEFIAEKLVSKFIYSVIAYVSRSLYQCLSRLPLHDTITITDDVGDTFTPAVGNVTVEQPEWIGFDTCKLTIKFNNGENSNFVWTK